MSSRSDAWIVGFGSAQGNRPISWHWDGVDWSPVRVPNVGPSGELYSVATLGPDDAWAVGSSGADSEQARSTFPLVEHWNGINWTVVPTPHVGAGRLLSVSADGGADVWAVGSIVTQSESGNADLGMRPLVLHWDGRRWSAVALDSTPAGELDQIVAVTPSDVWIAADGLNQNERPFIRHWNGARWIAVRAPFGRRDPITGFAATSSEDAWAVGAMNIRGHSRTLAAHWDGHEWAISPTPDGGTDSGLVGVVTSGPDNVWAIGTSENVHETHQSRQFQSTLPRALFLHWNGRSWKVEKTSNAGSYEDGLTVAAAPDGSAWAIGTHYYDTTVERWTGKEWRPVRHPRDRYYLAQSSSRR